MNQQEKAGAYGAYAKRVTCMAPPNVVEKCPEWALDAVNQAPMPRDIKKDKGEKAKHWQARMLDEHRRCWKEFWRLLAVADDARTEAPF